MTRTFLLGASALLFAACTASSDDVGAVGEQDTAMLAEGEAVCPDALVLDLDAYGDETLPGVDVDNYVQWFAANGEREGVQTTGTGLQYRVIQPGIENGLTPARGDEIAANYHGYFPDGRVFDSSYERGSPLFGPSDGFIKGWNEALADMKVCEARTLYIPGDLAYGNVSRGGRPAGTLLFHMQLLRVNRPEGVLIGVDRDTEL